MSYAEHFTKYLRLSILRVLTQAPSYSANDSVISHVSGEMGLSTTRDRIRTELTWLEEQGLVMLSKPVEGVTVACLTERGADAAEGRATVPGVQRPSPKG